MSQGNPDFRVLLPEWNQPEPYFEFPNAKKRTLQAQRKPWRLATDNKNQPVHLVASTCESLLNVYPDAIEIGSPLGSEGKTIFGTLFLVSMTVFMVMFVYAGVAIWDPHEPMLIGTSALMFFASVIAFLAAAACFKIVFFSPRDLPVLFNRKTRQVSFIQLQPFIFLRFWKVQRVAEPRTYSWDDVKARSYKMTQFTGAAARQTYFLTLLWGEPSKPNLCKEIVNIGYAGWWEDAVLWRLYEHIRRYMEEGGAPIQPGERLRRSGVGKVPAFSPELIAAAGGTAVSDHEVGKLANRG